MEPQISVSFEDDGQRQRALGPKPILFRFCIDDHETEYIPLALIHTVLRKDDALLFWVGDRRYKSTDQEVIDRFMAEWEVR